jgi:cytoplasmic iron level regulating protein YaaA (DUF328/UPF0246 family)
MIFVLSPAKTLDYTSPLPSLKPTVPHFMERSAELIEVLQQYSPADIGQMMAISDSLAHLNVARYASWSPRATTGNARPAIFAFNGDVYEGLGAGTLDAKALDYAQRHVRILSGLYGLLRPLDLMQPYRLEMGTRLATPRGRNLYDFWDDSVTAVLRKHMKQQELTVLVNLASEEYFKVVRPEVLDAPVITPVFEDWKSGKYKTISFYAKHARGKMARFAAMKRITEPEQLKTFSEDSYAFVPDASSETRWVFRRRADD